MNSDEIGWAAETACLLEVSAPKPGNVTWKNDFHDTCFEDFLLSATAVGPAFRRAAGRSVGETVLRAVRDTRGVVSVNTNLGIILLLAPLARAAGLYPGVELRKGLEGVLAGLTVDDARMVYEAVRLVNPGGLGDSVRGDVREKEVRITLGEAMALARERDGIASEYCTGFSVTFGIGCPALQEALKKGVSFSDAVVQMFLTILALVPDTLIVRKRGEGIAARVSRGAEEVLAEGGVHTEKGRGRLKEFDLYLRDEANSLNPGTTADITAAVIFVHLVENGFKLNPGR